MSAPPAWPRLALLVGVEMWERYSFYGLRALLVLFLTGAPSALGLGWSADRAILLFAVYGAVSYLFPVFGGWVADRRWGPRRCVAVGGWMIVAGHIALSAPLLLPVLAPPQHARMLRDAGEPIGDPWAEARLAASLRAQAASRGEDPEAAVSRGLAESRLTGGFLLLGLLLVSLGTGLFKPSVTTLVGRLHAPDDPRRERAYGIFYTGINAGTALGLILCGYVGERLGWHYGLLTAAIGFAPALLVYAVAAPRLLGGDEAPASRRDSAPAPMSRGEVRRVLLLFSLFPFAVLFWMGVEQFGGALALFARDHVDRSLAGFEVPIVWLVLANPAAIILLAPLLGQLWTQLERQGRNPLGVTKIGASLLMVAAAYAMLAMIGGAAASSGATISVAWLLGFYVLLGVGEVLLQPVALAQIGLHAPRRLESAAVGFWYLSIAAGSLAAGMVGASLASHSFTWIFWFLAALSAAGGACALALRPLHRRLLGPAGPTIDTHREAICRSRD